MTANIVATRETAMSARTEIMIEEPIVASIAGITARTAGNTEATIMTPVTAITTDTVTTNEITGGIIAVIATTFGVAS